MFYLLSSHHMAKKVSRRFMSDLVVSASQNAVSFDFFVREIHSIFHRNHISLASCFYCSCFEIVQASHLYTKMCSIQHSFCMNGNVSCGYLLVLISISGKPCLIALFLMQFQYSCVHNLILKYPSTLFELIPLLEFIPFDKDVNL